MPRDRRIDFGLAVFSFCIYLAFGYWLERHETIPNLLLYGCLFSIYGYLIFFDRREIDLKFWLVAALVFRVCFLFSTPALSDDVYRFIWDGRVLNAGISPYAFLPSELISDSGEYGLTPALYAQLNSPLYYSIYPPFAQIIFWFATWLFPDSVLGSTVVIRLLVIAAEAGTVWMMVQLLAQWKLPAERVLWYALNPLVILELSGNLHFEAFVVFFVLASIYLMLRSRWISAGASMAMAVATKLVPLILLPLFLLRIPFSRSIVFYGISLVTLVVLFFPFYSPLGVDGFWESIQLYFKKFEFNASIYYLAREYGYWNKGYNTIETTGWKLGVYAFSGIILLSIWPWVYHRARGWSFRKISYPESMRDVPEVALGVFFIYLLFATTVHPWYVIVPVALCVFTYMRFPIVWSFFIFLTYAGYTATGFDEQLWIVIVEYVVVFAYFGFEIWQCAAGKLQA